MWVVVALLTSFAGFAVLALAMPRHHHALMHREPGGMLKWVLRSIGAVLLGAAFAACIPVWGWAIGPVAWFGVLSAAALAFVILFVFIPRGASGLAVVSASAAAAVVLATLAD